MLENIYGGQEERAFCMCAYIEGKPIPPPITVQVYTFGPTFRAENSNTSRHLAEFWVRGPGERRL